MEAKYLTTKIGKKGRKASGSRGKMTIKEYLVDDTVKDAKKIQRNLRRTVEKCARAYKEFEDEVVENGIKVRKFLLDDTIADFRQFNENTRLTRKGAKK
jgi:hypothetical protein